MGKTPPRGEVSPTEPVDEHLLTAFDDISATEDGPSQFSMMTDGARFNAVRPVFYEPVYYLHNNPRPISQRILYSTQVRTRPKSQRQLIEGVDRALTLIREDNPVKLYRDNVAAVMKMPSFFERISETILTMQSAQSQVIGGLLMVKCASTNQVGLRCTYNKSLMALTGWLDGLTGVGAEDALDDTRTRDMSALLAMLALDQSIKRKPAIVTIPNTIGFQGI